MLDWSGVLLFCLCAALAAILEVLLVPLYAGSVIVPVSVLGAVLFNIALPRLARSLVDTTLASLLPFLTWLVVVIVLGGLPRPEGDVILPGGGGAAQWVGYGVLLGGALTGTVTIVAASNPA